MSCYQWPRACSHYDDLDCFQAEIKRAPFVMCPEHNVYDCDFRGPCASSNDRSVRPVTGGSGVESPALAPGSTPSPTSEETK